MSHPLRQYRRNYRVCSLVRTRSVKSGFLLYLTIRLFIFGNSEQIEPLFERIDNIILKCYHLNIKGVLPVTVDQLLLSIKNAAKRIRS